MLKRLRKSSGRVTLVLIGVAALGGCGRQDEMRRDVYKSREDCLADWGNKPEDCTPATERRHASGGFFYGPLYAMGAMNAMNAMRGGSNWSGDARPGSRAIGSSTTGSPTRGGFGSSGRSSAS
jgi:hypothetical protein